MTTANQLQNKNSTAANQARLPAGFITVCNHIDSVDSTVTAKMNSYWTQIANTFKTYDSRLLFAGANEPPVKTAAQMSVLLNYYQTFINAVRATGGSNSSRWLVLPGPSTDIDLTDSLMNTLPSDSTFGRLMVEVHYYSPYQFTLMSSDASWGNMFYFWGNDYHSTTLPSRNATWGEEAYLDAEFQKMQNKFISRGIPVILGEFGAYKRGNLTGADYNLNYASATYFDKYVVDSANNRGMKPIFWNTLRYIFDWTTGAVTDQSTINALTGRGALPPPGTPTPPSAPTSLTATAVSSSQIKLSWAASSGATSYNVKRATVSGGPYTTIATGVTGTTYSDTGLAASTTYYYVVSAVNAGGESPNSTQASATTLAGGSVPPAPTGLTATAGNAQVSLSWTASSGATSYNVKRATVSGGPYTTVATGVTGTSYVNTGLVNGTTYYYVVSAVNAIGESPNSAQVSATPTAGGAVPPAPTGLSVTDDNNHAVLTWSAPTGATSYKVKRATVSGGPYTVVATPTGTTYTDTTVVSGTYYYVVSAVNAVGEGPNSAQVSYTPRG